MIEMLADFARSEHQAGLKEAEQIGLKYLSQQIRQRAKELEKR